MANFPQPAFCDTGDIRLAVHELGAGPAVVLLHGFPELAYSWRHQLPALANAGYRAIAPDMRGYGASDKPPAVGDYTVQKLVGDVTGLMDVLGIDKAVIAGHDWGALVAWQMALLAPRRMAGLIALNIPFFRRPPLNPVTLMRWRFGNDFYIVNFQDSDEADRRFAADPGRFIDTVMRRRSHGIPRHDGKRRRSRLPWRRRGLSLLSLLDRQPPDGEPLLDDEALCYYANAFGAGGFTGPINWYRNFAHNWRSTRGVTQTVRVPTLFIGADRDTLVSRRQIEAMHDDVPDLETRMIADCGHWTQQEQPDALNRLMLDWLERRYPVNEP